MSKFDLRNVIRQEIMNSLERRGDVSARDEIIRLQQSKSLAQVFGFAGPGFESTVKKGPTFSGPGGAKGFLGPGFKK